MPNAPVSKSILFGDISGQHNRLGQNQLGDGAGIRVGGVEYSHAVFRGRSQINLIGANAETAHGNEMLCLSKELSIKLGAGADTDNMDFGNPSFQLIGW